LWPAAGCAPGAGLTRVTGYWSDGRVLTTTAYAEQLAAGDTGSWQSATRCAAAWIAPQAPTIDLSRRFPLTQLQLQTLALLIYGLARGRGDDPARFTAREVIDWLAQHRLPAPPEPAGPVTGDEVREALSLWRHEFDAALDRCCRDLTVLLAAAGHDVPEPGTRGLDRYSPDPVITVWLTLVDTEAGTIPSASYLDLFRPPLLAVGLTGLLPLAG
jgi:hypothetical protein